MKRDLRPIHRRRLGAIDFDLAVLIAAAGADGISITKLALDASNITGRRVTEDDVRAQLQPLLSRGALTLRDGRFALR